MTPYDTFAIELSEGRVMVSGELDNYSAPAMSESLLRLAGANPQPLELDLSAVTFMDAGGLRALLQLRRSLPMLSVVAVSPRIQRVLTVTDTCGLILGPDDETSRRGADSVLMLAAG